MMDFALLSQRCDFVKQRNEYRDSIDINWYKVIKKIKMFPLIVPNDTDLAEKIISYTNPKLIVLTGGGDVNLNKSKKIESNPRNDVEIKLIDYATKNKIRLIGICRGQQILNFYFGGKLSFIGEKGGHNKTTHEITINYKDINYNKISVNSFHNYIIKQSDLSKDLIKIGVCNNDNSVEAFKHYKYPIFGISWHPERNGGEGYELALKILRGL